MSDLKPESVTEELQRVTPCLRPVYVSGMREGAEDLIQQIRDELLPTLDPLGKKLVSDFIQSDRCPIDFPSEADLEKIWRWWYCPECLKPWHDTWDEWTGALEGEESPPNCVCVRTDDEDPRRWIEMLPLVLPPLMKVVTLQFKEVVTSRLELVERESDV